MGTGRKVTLGGVWVGDRKTLVPGILSYDCDKQIWKQGVGSDYTRKILTQNKGGTGDVHGTPDHGSSTSQS